MHDLRHYIETRNDVYEFRWVCTSDTIDTDISADQEVVYLIDGFWIMTCEVTEDLKEWYLHLRNDASTMPLTDVTLDDALSLCKAISSPARQYTIPTRDQWLLAYHGGIASEGYSYSGSNNPSYVGWTKENSGGRLHKGGERIPNELGLYDMTGNVAELVYDGTATAYIGGSYLDAASSLIALPSNQTPPPQVCGLRLVLHEPLWFNKDSERVFHLKQ